MGVEPNQKHAWRERNDWREWLAWETTPLYGGIAFYLLFKLNDQTPWKGWKEELGELVVTCLLTYLISVPILLLIYFAGRLVARRSRTAFVMVGFIVGIVVMKLISSDTPVPMVRLIGNGLVGVIIASCFHMLAYTRDGPNQPVQNNAA